MYMYIYIHIHTYIPRSPVTPRFRGRGALCRALPLYLDLYIYIDTDIYPAALLPLAFVGVAPFASAPSAAPGDSDDKAAMEARRCALAAASTARCAGILAPSSKVSALVLAKP